MSALVDNLMEQRLGQVLNVLMVVFSALMIWKGLMVVTGSESPIVVVLRCGAGAPLAVAVLNLGAVEAWSPPFSAATSCF
jgi:hypothetical protein